MARTNSHQYQRESQLFYCNNSIDLDLWCCHHFSPAHFSTTPQLTPLPKVCLPLAPLFQISLNFTNWIWQPSPTEHQLGPPKLEPLERKGCGGCSRSHHAVSFFSFKCCRSLICSGNTPGFSWVTCREGTLLNYGWHPRINKNVERFSFGDSLSQWCLEPGESNSQ